MENSVYLLGVPGNSGGAATKIAHLIKLLNRDFRITDVLPNISWCKDREVKQLTEPYGVRCCLLKELPKEVNGIGLAVCEKEFFSSPQAREVKARGLKLVWSNEMMFPFN